MFSACNGAISASMNASMSASSRGRCSGSVKSTGGTSWTACYSSWYPGWSTARRPFTRARRHVATPEQCGQHAPPVKHLPVDGRRAGLLVGAAGAGGVELANLQDQGGARIRSDGVECPRNAIAGPPKWAQVVDRDLLGSEAQGRRQYRPQRAHHLLGSGHCATPSAPATANGCCATTDCVRMISPGRCSGRLKSMSSPSRRALAAVQRLLPYRR